MFQRRSRIARGLLAVSLLGSVGVAAGLSSPALNEASATSANPATATTPAAAPLNFKLDPVHCMAFAFTTSAPAGSGGCSMT